jgi:hypothetical protein
LAQGPSDAAKFHCVLVHFMIKGLALSGIIWFQREKLRLT